MAMIKSQLTPEYLQYEAIKAQLSMVSSPNHTVMYIPVGPMGVPLVGTIDMSKIRRAASEGSSRLESNPCHGPALVQNGFKAPALVHDSGGEDDPCTIEHLRGAQLEVFWERRGGSRDAYRGGVDQSVRIAVARST